MSRFKLAGTAAFAAVFGLLLTQASAIAADQAATGAESSLTPAGMAAGPTPNAMISDAVSLLRANKNQQAADELKRVISMAPNMAEAHHNYALALAKLGDTDGAIAEFNKAIELRPDLDSSWLTLAGLHQSIGHIETAISLYNEFLKRFQNRTDLNDTRKKIEQLVKGLQAESNKMRAAHDGTVALQGANPVLSNGVLQTPAQSVATDDYIPEATNGLIVRWPAARMPIRIYIHDAQAVPHYKPEWRDILVRSFNDWQAASNGLVRFTFVNEMSDADVDCMFLAEPAKGHQKDLKNDAEAGEANMYTNQEGLTKGTIKLLTKSLSSVLPLTDNRMRVICLHEIGHALGLAGHTANPDDIMFYSTSFKDEWRDLSGRDARTIQRLYSGK